MRITSARVEAVLKEKFGGILQHHDADLLTILLKALNEPTTSGNKQQVLTALRLLVEEKKVVVNANQAGSRLVRIATPTALLALKANENRQITKDELIDRLLAEIRKLREQLEGTDPVQTSTKT
ncbi:MAG TPA: hypothetical protein VLG40_03395 [Candidatus Saccharimonas sp.]|nr:hypothetical protein [Candidatus Saccharimonas sp.]